MDNNPQDDGFDMFEERQEFPDGGSFDNSAPISDGSELDSHELPPYGFCKRTEVPPFPARRGETQSAERGKIIPETSEKSTPRPDARQNTENQLKSTETSEKLEKPVEAKRPESRQTPEVSQGQVKLGEYSIDRDGLLPDAFWGRYAGLPETPKGYLEDWEREVAPALASPGGRRIAESIAHEVLERHVTIAVVNGQTALDRRLQKLEMGQTELGRRVAGFAAEVTVVKSAAAETSMLAGRIGKELADFASLGEGMRGDVAALRKEVGGQFVALAGPAHAKWQEMQETLEERLNRIDAALERQAKAISGLAIRPKDGGNDALAAKIDALAEAQRETWERHGKTLKRIMIAGCAIAALAAITAVMGIAGEFHWLASWR